MPIAYLIKHEASKNSNKFLNLNRELYMAKFISHPISTFELPALSPVLESRVAGMESRVAVIGVSGCYGM